MWAAAEEPLSATIVFYFLGIGEDDRNVILLTKPLGFGTGGRVEVRMEKP